MDGLAGDDTLTATAGTIRGGTGRDTYLSADEATDGWTVNLGRGAHRAILVGTWDTTVLGGPGDDVVEVPSRGPGVDTLVGVRLRGGRGDDRLTFANNQVPVRVNLRTRTARWSQGRIVFSGVNEFHRSERADVLRGSRRPAVPTGCSGVAATTCCVAWPGATSCVVAVTGTRRTAAPAGTGARPSAGSPAGGADPQPRRPSATPRYPPEQRRFPPGP